MKITIKQIIWAFDQARLWIMFGVVRALITLIDSLSSCKLYRKLKGGTWYYISDIDGYDYWTQQKPYALMAVINDVEQYNK